MRFLSHLALAVVLLTTTSCFDIIERIILHADGTGQYVTVMDMSAMMQGIMDFAQELGDEEIDMGEDLDPELGAWDTVVYFSSMMDTMRERLKHPDLVARYEMRGHLNVLKGEMIYTLHFPFENLDEVNLIQEDMAMISMMQEAAMGEEEGGGAGGFASCGTRFSMQNGLFRRVESTDFKTCMNASAGEDELGLFEDKKFVKMIFEDGTYTTEYVFSGEVEGKVKGYTISDDRHTLSRTVDLYKLYKRQVRTRGRGERAITRTAPRE